MTQALHRAAVLMLVLLMHFCSPTDALNALAPSDGITLTHAVAYAEGPRHQLDIYSPRGSYPPSSTGPPDPVVVFFFGGGFQEGSRDWYRFAAATLAERGIVVVVPDYRLYPQARFPAFMHDAAQAVAWVHTNIGRFGGDPHRLFLMGHSVGGQIAALLALDRDYLAAVNLSPHDICGLIGLAGPYDYTPPDPAGYAAIFGHADQWPVSRPITHVTVDAPPALLLTGRADSVVEPGNTTRLAARLRAAGVPVTAQYYSGITHGAIMAAMSDTLGFLAPVRDASLHFIAEHPACGGAVSVTPAPPLAAPSSAIQPR